VISLWFVKVLKPNLAIEKSSYREQQNMWIGPRQVSVRLASSVT